jgi:hypothetical protein
LATIDYLLFTTCDVQGGRLSDLTRLLSSLSAGGRQDHLLIRHYVLLQRASEVPQDLLPHIGNGQIVMCVASRLSLSRARNLMIEQAKRDGVIQSEVTCAFPDDDAWYPEGVLAAFREIFRADPHVGILTCRYGSNPIGAADQSRVLSSFRLSRNCGTYMRQASSNTIFVRGDVLARTGYFDERIGVGTAISGGEDVDFALRAYYCSGHQVLISDEQYVGHRDHTAALRSKYFAGDTFAIARSARCSTCVAIQLLRKVCIGAYLLITRELSPSEYLRALGKAFAGMTARETWMTPIE